MDTHASIEISHERLGLYSRYIRSTGPDRTAFPALADNPSHLGYGRPTLRCDVVDLYEGGYRVRFAHSLRRNIGHGLWRPVAYSFPRPASAEQTPWLRCTAGCP